MLLEDELCIDLMRISVLEPRKQIKQIKLSLCDKGGLLNLSVNIKICLNEMTLHELQQNIRLVSDHSVHGDVLTVCDSL